MPYSGPSSSLYYNFLQNLDDMETAITEMGGLKTTRIIVFLSTSETESKLIEIRYDKGECTRNVLKVYGTYDHTSREGIANILKDVKHYTPAPTYAIITGCHGEGWLPKLRDNDKLKYFGGGISKYQIDIDDFAGALSDAGIHAQFLLFDDCYLSCVEVAYSLRNVTDYLIASTSEVMNYGMPYHKILKYLVGDNPDYNQVCNDFLTFYSSYTYPYGTLGVTDCRNMDAMAAMMKEINATHEYSTETNSELQDLDGGHSEPTRYFDFGDYVRHLCGNDEATYDRYNILLKQLVPYKVNTPSFYSGRDGSVTPIKTFSGITVSDPSIDAKAMASKMNTLWWKATH